MKPAAESIATMPHKIKYFGFPATIANTAPIRLITENTQMIKHIIPNSIHKNLMAKVL